MKNGKRTGVGPAGSCRHRGRRGGRPVTGGVGGECGSGSRRAFPVAAVSRVPGEACTSDVERVRFSCSPGAGGDDLRTHTIGAPCGGGAGGRVEYAVRTFFSVGQRASYAGGGADGDIYFFFHGPCATAVGLSEFFLWIIKTHYVHTAVFIIGFPTVLPFRASLGGVFITAVTARPTDTLKCDPIPDKSLRDLYANS